MRNSTRARAGAVLLVSLTLAVHFAAAAAGEWRQSLDGPWQFSTSSATPATTFLVPGNWDTSPALATYVGEGWYRRTFDVPADWRGKRVRLCFGAVYDTATVQLNGRELGSHRGGYTPFEFDVTDRLEYGRPNQLAVCADNTFHRGAWWPWGGISRPVYLVANNAVRIVSQHIRAEPDMAAGSARLFVQETLLNAGDQPQTLALDANIDGLAVPELSRRLTVAAHAGQTVELSASLPRERVRLWDFDHPNLYRLTTRLVQAGGNVVHEASDRFGIRRVEVRPDGLYLNGERIHVCGFNRVSDSPETGNTEPDQLVRADIDLMKSASANLARIMHFAQAPGLLDYLDEKGMLLFEEIPVWGPDDPNMRPDNPLTQQWMRETIERDYNHPCIIGWSVGNELRHHYDYGKSMIAYTRTLDPHRLVTVVSNSGHLPEYGPGNDPISFSDILLQNYYGEDTGKATDILHQKWPSLPIFFSEFGSKQLGAAPEAEIPGLQKRWDGIAARPYVIGASIWTFNDYRDGFARNSATGVRAWGVVDMERRPKAAYAQVRRLFSPVRALTADVGGTVAVTPRRVDEIPSYTLRGYQIRWAALDVGNKPLREGTEDLPDLKPGDATWTKQLSPPPGTVEMTARLFTPTGYDVADSP